MNFELPNIPERDAKPRKNGLTMMMDKGLSCAIIGGPKSGKTTLAKNISKMVM